MDQPDVSPERCECIGDGKGGHHPMCDRRPAGARVRGFIGYNGFDELCFFEHSMGEGVPLYDDDFFDRVEAAAERRVPRDLLHALDPPESDTVPSDPDQGAPS